MTATQNDGFTQTLAVGGETTIDWDFLIYAKTDLLVLKTSAAGVISTLALNTHYTIADDQVNDPTGGTLGLITPAVAGEKYTCLADIPESRSADFQQGGDFFSATLNTQLDRLTRLTQQLRRDVDKKAGLPADSTLTSVTLPDPEDGRAPIWSGVNGEMVNGPTASEIAGAQEFAEDAEAAKVAAELARDEAEAAAAQLPLNNFGATANPTVNDDSGDGYSVGSRWVNLTTDEAWICTDSTLGAAVWVDLTLTSAEVITMISSAILGKQTLWIPAIAIKPATTSGPAFGTYEGSSNKNNYDTLDFDGSTRENAHFQIAMPKSWDKGTVTYQVYWKSTATDTDGVVWGLEAVAIDDNGTLDVAYGTAVTVTDTLQNNANELYISAESSALTVGGTPANGKMINFRVYRDPANGSDTASEDASLLGIKLFFTNNALNDT